MSAAPETTTVPVATEPTVPQSAGPTEPSVPATSNTTAAPAAPADVKVAEDAPVAAVGGTAAVAGNTSEKTVDSNKAEVVATPITSGVLGYKAPGLITQLKPFKKQYFWLGDEAVPAKDLHQFLRGTKPDVAQPVAAWASQTGKGLLFFSKDEKKGAIADAIALADVTYITKEGTQDFSFRYGPKKHQYKLQAATQDERNGWVVAVTSAHEQAKKDKESVESTEAYKNSLKELKEPSKAATGAAAGGAAATAAAGAGAAAASKQSKETPKETAKEAEASKETPKEAAKEPEAAKKDTAKERSQSRKRASIFGGFGKKKEEKAEEKEEKKEEKAEKKEEKAEEKAEKKEAKEAEKKAEESKGETAAVAGGAAAAATAGTAAAATHAEKTDKAAEDKTTEPSDKSASNSAERSKSKRRSGLFGLFDKKAAPEKKDESKVDAFKEDPVAAPDHKETTTKKEEVKPVEAFKDDPVAPEAAKKENVATPAAAGTEKATTPGDKEKRRSSFFGLGSKFGSVRNKQPKETKAEEPKPAAVAEAKIEDKATTVPPTAAVESAPVVEAPKEEPKAIGDVVPEAVSIGQEQAPAATNGAATAPVVTTSA